mmetsp:Transcript_113057/g.365116  ORF Transcript_113057/g.365116 Transcript_113057/m.365116 type:complete len:162 (+) Transcript_113057:68-553(+)
MKNCLMEQAALMVLCVSVAADILDDTDHHSHPQVLLTLGSRLESMHQTNRAVQEALAEELTVADSMSGKGVLGLPSFAPMVRGAHVARRPALPMVALQLQEQDANIKSSMSDWASEYGPTDPPPTTVPPTHLLFSQMHSSGTNSAAVPVVLLLAVATANLT